LLLYYITDGSQLPGPESQRRESLLKKIAAAAQAGVDYVQLREKDLAARELESLALDAAHVIRESNSKTRLLINSRTDVALAAGADGVHLTSRDISPADVRKVWREANASEPLIAASCHSEADVIAAKNAAADFVVLGPVFEKSGTEGMPVNGIEQLRQACRHGIPVFALGGVTTANAHLCVEAGASGLAAIRLFQEDDVAAVVRKLRVLQ
jgi:thiamine-phosphate pyrophosphorylase